MEGEFFKNAVNIARYIITEKVHSGDIVLDATIGNGHDTSFLAKLVGEKGKVYGFDIQKEAINATRKRLVDEKLESRVKLIQDSHENINEYIDEQIDFIIFNLGYLPGSDHHIMTRPKSTIPALSKSLNILKQNGMLLILAYSGHPGGEEEKVLVERFIQGLEQSKYNSIKLDFINQVNKPPILYGVEKK